MNLFYQKTWCDLGSSRKLCRSLHYLMNWFIQGKNIIETFVITEIMLWRITWQVIQTRLQFTIIKSILSSISLKIWHANYMLRRCFLTIFSMRTIILILFFPFITISCNSHLLFFFPNLQWLIILKECQICCVKILIHIFP